MTKKKYVLYLVPILVSFITFAVSNMIVIKPKRLFFISPIMPTPPFNNTNISISIPSSYIPHPTHPIDPLLASIIVGIVSFAIVFFVARKLK